MTEYPAITKRNYTLLSPFAGLVEKNVRFSRDEPDEVYHGITGRDYVCMVSVAKNGKIPLVRQFRPVVEQFTWELPAGTVDGEEQPVNSAIRELAEETGFACKRRPVSLGRFAADTGRLEIYVHGFLFKEVQRKRCWVAEDRVECRLFDSRGIRALIKAGEFTHIMHIAYLYLAGALQQDQ